MWKTNYVNLDQFILEPSLKICATILFGIIYQKQAQGKS